ncbi:hypothetical protein SLS62_010773 [Diatrype stigma]|uniref:CFEM domain-containing protein n=1 Tax=Diatrype stigma TaxID=117547 RepID=A0AAN9YFI4_9PEZI
MHVRYLTFILCALLQPAVAQINSGNTEGPPDCGRECILTTVVNSNSTCAPTDAPCICGDKVLQLEIQKCVIAGCPVRDQLSTQKYSYELCGVEGRDRRVLVRVIAIVFGLLALVAFVLRCVARLSAYGTRSWGPDDWVMTLTILWYFDAVLYVTCLGLTKVSILLFYLTVFPKRSFRAAAHLLVAGNAAYVAVFGCLMLFQCRPVAGAWRAWDGDPAHAARCIDLNVLGWSGAAANIVLDLATIALPMPELFALSMSRRKKVQIVGMFALGFLWVFLFSPSFPPFQPFLAFSINMSLVAILK